MPDVPKKSHEVLAQFFIRILNFSLSHNVLEVIVCYLFIISAILSINIRIDYIHIIKSVYRNASIKRPLLFNAPLE